MFYIGKTILMAITLEMPTHYRAFLQISHNAPPAAIRRQDTVAMRGVGVSLE
jgi:hypothetical protein